MNESKAMEIGKYGLDLDESEQRDPYSEVWNDIKEKKDGIWGGRAQGGRGVQKIKGKPKSVSLDQVTISFDGRDILENASLKFNIKHRYGLLGSNGVGKTTLLRRISRGSIPGFPTYFNIHYVQQEAPSMSDVSVFEYLRMNDDSDSKRNENKLDFLKKEELELEKLLDSVSGEKEIQEISNRLCDIYEEIESLQSSSSEPKHSIVDLKSINDVKLLHEQLTPEILVIIKGLRLSSLKNLQSSISSLSGGWRMRCFLAKSLSKIKEGDIVLLDECTNHLDIECIEWLEEYLVNQLPPAILLLVSHDHEFLENVCTDIIEMKNRTLSYFPGTFSNFLIHQEEVMQLQKHRCEKEQYQERLVQGIIENVKSHGQISSVRSKTKKLERVGMHSRLDGKKFKLFSLKAISEDFLRFPDRIEAIKENRSVRFKFAEPDLVCLRLATADSPIFSIELANIGWQSGMSPPTFILNDITLQFKTKCKIAITGSNGSGKTTLVAGIIEAINGNSLPLQSQSTDVVKTKRGGISVFKPPSNSTSTIPIKSNSKNDNKIDKISEICKSDKNLTIIDDCYTKPVIQGIVSCHPNLRVGVVSQNHIAALSEFLMETAVSYIISESKIKRDLNWSELTARAHLGAFGLGDVALQKIGSLSGGQKARLAFSSSCIGSPHVLILDEPTNHLSIESIEGLAIACRDYTGALVFASHNRYFINLVANQILHIDKGKATLNFVDT